MFSLPALCPPVDAHDPSCCRSAVRGASTLALADAETYPERVTELVLRGIFLMRRAALDGCHSGGGLPGAAAPGG